MEIFGYDCPFYVIFLVFLGLILIRIGRCTHSTFSNLGVPGPCPWPFIGNMVQMYIKGIPEFERSLLAKYGKVVGYYEGLRPSLLISDTDILRHILVKDFISFANRREVVQLDPPFNQILTSLKDDTWRKVRGHITPAFSMTKLKKMVGQINECAEVLMKNVESKFDLGSNINIKDLTTAYTMDVITRTAFGIQLDSLNDPGHPFVKHTKEVFQPRMLLLTIALISPRFMNFLRSKFGFTLFPKASLDFFLKATLTLIEDRRKQPKEEIDFLQLMIKAHQTSNNGEQRLSDDEVTAQAILFIVSGTETTASTLAFLCYNLACHQHVQHLVLEEINSIARPEDNSVSEDELNKLSYMEKCIYETLRLYSPSVRVDRECTKDITINGLFIPEGMLISIPIAALHYDPVYWPEPHKFNPERFNNENKLKQTPFTWLPFGQGPRNCIGIKLAMMELKIAMVKLLRKFHLDICSETQIPLKFNKGSILQTAKPIILAVKERKV